MTETIKLADLTPDCETLGRECNGTENNPATFAVALQRYQDAFGIKPELVN